MRLTKPQAEAITRLAKSPDYEELAALFAAQLADADKSNRSAEGVSLHRLQGRAQLLADLVGLPENARKTLAGR
ncbi:MAG: hypothetical protein C0434_08020 [Xanthomonadaceae bacterium]|nr:hypothetical protein [Xanthomonadaceae bacterium]